MAIANEIGKFTVENEGCVVTVDETIAGETGVISLTTSHMQLVCALRGNDSSRLHS